MTSLFTETVHPYLPKLYITIYRSSTLLITNYGTLLFTDYSVDMGDVIDDLADIYLDLKGALLLFDSTREGSSDDVYWKLKFDFDLHIADHTINAIKAIHDYLCKD